MQSVNESQVFRKSQMEGSQLSVEHDNPLESNHGHLNEGSGPSNEAEHERDSQQNLDKQGAMKIESSSSKSESEKKSESEYESEYDS